MGRPPWLVVVQRDHPEVYVRLEADLGASVILDRRRWTRRATRYPEPARPGGTNRRRQERRQSSPGADAVAPPGAPFFFVRRSGPATDP